MRNQSSHNSENHPSSCSSTPNHSKAPFQHPASTSNASRTFTATKSSSFHPTSQAFHRNAHKNLSTKASWQALRGVPLSKVTFQPSKEMDSETSNSSNPSESSSDPSESSSDPSMAELYPVSPMFYIELLFGKIPVQALLDSGASMNFISERVASELRLRRHKLHAGQTIVAATGENIACAHFTHVYVQMGVLKFYVNLRIIPMHPDLILGVPSIVCFNPLINWQERSFRVMRYGNAYWIPIVQKSTWS